MINAVEPDCVSTRLMHRSMEREEPPLSDGSYSDVGRTEEPAEAGLSS